MGMWLNQLYDVDELQALDQNKQVVVIYPAAINTELLDTISDKGMAEQMQNLYDRYGISPDRIANIAAFAIDQPEDTTINEFTVGPANQPW